MSLKDLLRPNGPGRWLLPPQEGSRVPMTFYGNDAVIKQMEEKVFEQAVAVSKLPRVQHVSNTEDGHVGASCSIGATIGFDVRDGFIAPDLVGYDIGCGMRLITTNLTAADVKSREVRRALIKAVEARVPLGIGVKTKHSFTGEKFQDLLARGAVALVEAGVMDEYDFQRLEEPGMKGSDPHALSPRALQRGIDTLGSLGGGNHFIEVQIVDVVRNPELAQRWGLFEGQVVIMLHTGSRGLGYQVNADTVEEMKEFFELWDLHPEVLYLPIKSEMGQKYFRAQAAAINFAVANKTLITGHLYDAFAEVFGKSREALDMKVVYDILHNIARTEHHGDKTHLVIRKGATRALPAGHHMNPEVYKETGHPVLIPGSMGTYSYVLVGQEGGKDNYYTVPHGSGRVMSRSGARKTIKLEEFEKWMDERDIITNERNLAKMLDEAPMAYKDSDQIMESVELSGRANVVVKLRPVAVIKGTEDLKSR